MRIRMQSDGLRGIKGVKWVSVPVTTVGPLIQQVLGALVTQQVVHSELL